MKKYYQDELSYLREMGREFVAAHPEAAPFLAEGGADPDVERLLEGFAFLTARIRHKLEDEFPELTHGIMAMFWPHYLRPIPAMTIVQFEALPQARRDLRRIARGSALDSQPVDGTRCRFRTSYEVTLTPFALEEVELKQGTSATLRLRLRLPEGVRLDQLGLDALRLFLNGDAAARSLAVCLCRYTRRVVVRAGPGGGERSFEPSVVRPVGLTAAELLLPAPAVSPEGYRILHEYLAFPEKCRFVDLLRVDQWSALKGAQYFDVIFDLARIPDDTPPVDATSILLHCTPAINLFPHDADAIRITHDRTEYLLRPAAAAGSTTKCIPWTACRDWCRARPSPASIARSTGSRTRCRPAMTCTTRPGWRRRQPATARRC
ncbi:MAG: type VI secretion system baseplate subunit TssF [Planctomycetota bacterium]